MHPDSGAAHPYGPTLTNLLLPPDEASALLKETADCRRLVLSARSLCDLELLATGAFSPLETFMGEKDYHRVVHDMRLASDGPDRGLPWTIPITLPAPSPDTATGGTATGAGGRATTTTASSPDDMRCRGPVKSGETIVLTDERNRPLAVMDVTEVFERDPREAELVFGTTDRAHPLVTEMETWGNLCLSGPLRVLGLPEHHDFPHLRRTPAETRAALAKMGNANVVAFQTRNPMHRVHEELTKRAAAKVGGSLLIHPAVGMTKPGDVDHFTRVRCYEAMVRNHYDPQRTLLSLLPIAMRMAGPREAVWHAIIRRNYGANHFIVGRDHASPGRDSTGKPFYGPTDAQELLRSFEDEIGVKMVPFEELVYLADEGRYVPRGEVPEGARVWSISGTQLRTEYLAKGRRLPDWFSRPQVASILAEAYRPRTQQGVCVWLTGLPCSGKSTISEILEMMLLERGRVATVLDGDVVRQHLSRGLGFSREDRIANNLRIAFVAAEIVRHGGTVICPVVSPFEEAREEARRMVAEAAGGGPREGSDHFLLVHVDTPVSICEARDVKGMYALARAGKITGFTGVDDPYEVPSAPDVVVHAGTDRPEDCARAVLAELVARGFVEDAADDSPRDAAAEASGEAEAAAAGR